MYTIMEMVQNFEVIFLIIGNLHWFKLGPYIEMDH
jgi:hypothetical protein